MAPALRTIVVSHQQTPQSPPRAVNAILTLFAVFAFFGVLILLVAGWIRCVEGMDGRLGDSDSICSSSKRKRKGFNDWYHKRRDTLQRRAAATPWRRPTDTKFWQEYQRPGEMTSLFRNVRRGSAAYNTFQTKWYRSSPSEEGDSDEDDSDSEVSASPRTLKFGSRPMMRHRSTDGITAGRLVPKKPKHQLTRTATAPVKTIRNVNDNKSHTGQRRKSSIGEDRNGMAKPIKIIIIRPKRQNSGGSMRSNWSTGRAKILDAVPEETGTGNTPER